MKVQALEMGFFGGQRIRPGQEFEVPDGTKAAWFFEVGDEVKAAKASTKKAKPDPTTLSQIEGSKQTFVEAMAKPKDGGKTTATETGDDVA